MKLSRIYQIFYLVSLHLGRYRPFIHWLGDRSVLSATYVYSTLDALSNKRCCISPFSPVFRDAVSHFYLLLGSGSLRVYRCQPYPILRPALVGVKSLYQPYPLSDRLEHYLELPCYHILLYLGRCSSQHSLSKEAEPSCIVC